MSEIFFIYCLNGSLGFTHACCWIKLFSWNTHSFLPRTLRYRDQILTLLEIMFYLIPMKLFWLKKKWFRGREKLRSAKRRAFVRIQEKKRRDASSHPRSTTTHSKTSEAPSLGLSTGSLFTSSQPVFCMQSFRGWPLSWQMSALAVDKEVTGRILPPVQTVLGEPLQPSQIVKIQTDDNYQAIFQRLGQDEYDLIDLVKC